MDLELDVNLPGLKNIKTLRPEPFARPDLGSNPVLTPVFYREASFSQSALQVRRPSGFVHQQYSKLSQQMARNRRPLPVRHRNTPMLYVSVIIALVAAVAAYWVAQQQRQTQHPKQKASGRLVPVTYNATVRDMTGQEQSFFFRHLIDSKRLRAGKASEQVRTAILKEVTMPHYKWVLWW
jgi:hypothetical protein